MAKQINVVLIDHNDSFTFNIVETIRQLKQCTITVINYATIKMKMIKKFDVIILSPGPCLPNDYPITQQIIKHFHQTKPILGICLGHQAICTFFGADLYQTTSIIHGMPKEITHVKDSVLLHEIPEKTTVGLYHSWAVSKTNFPKVLEIIALTKDKMIMGVQHKKFPVYGIQFHPESFLTTHGKQLLYNFINV